MLDDEVWFEPKTYGLGCGPPVHWKGWALVALHVVAVFATLVPMIKQPAFFERHIVAIVLVELLLAILPMPLYAMHTRGGWRWRWGDKD